MHVLRVLVAILLAGSIWGHGFSQSRTIKYQSTAEDFPNPERGFAFTYNVAWPSDTPWEFCNPAADPARYTYTAWTNPLKEADLMEYRKKNVSLVMIRYHIAAFRHKQLSAAFIKRLTEDFAVARKTGMKLIPRFVYNWPKGGPDAPLAVVLNHLETLSNVFKANADVLAFMELGFIGCWGEMHNSSYKLMDENGITEATRKVIEKVFSVVPAARMIAVRYPFYKFQYFGNNLTTPIEPVSLAEAFNGSIKARWGHHDDCLVCGEFNWGTYFHNKATADKIKAFLAKENQFVVQSGEPGGMDNSSDNDEDGDGFWGKHYADCARILSLLSTLHWSVMNYNYEGRKGANGISYQTWEQQGCYDEISKKLGYRFTLRQVTVPLVATAGQQLLLELVIKNEGWTNLYNPRHIEIVLRPSQGEVKRLPFQPATDERFWFPAANEEKQLLIQVKLPDIIKAGNYEILLNLPDPMPFLNTNPAYSIRLANTGVWEEKTGYNSLQTKIIIKNKGE